MSFALKETRLESPRVPLNELERVARVLAPKNHSVVLSDGRGNQTELPRELREFFSRIIEVVAKEETIPIKEAAAFFKTTEEELRELVEWKILLGVDSPEGLRVRLCDLFRFRNLCEADDKSSFGHFMGKLGLALEATGADTESIIYRTR